MTKKRWTVGVFLNIQLPDGTFGYCRLLEFPFIAFYNCRTDELRTDLKKLSSMPLIFTLPVHIACLDRWQLIGGSPVEDALKQIPETFMQDLKDFTKCRIFDSTGNERIAEPSECVGLERAAVWNARYVEERLLDTFLGRLNRYAESLRVRTI